VARIAAATLAGLYAPHLKGLGGLLVDGVWASELTTEVAPAVDTPPLSVAPIVAATRAGLYAPQLAGGWRLPVDGVWASEHTTAVSPAVETPALPVVRAAAAVVFRTGESDFAQWGRGVGHCCTEDDREDCGGATGAPAAGDRHCGGIQRLSPILTSGVSWGSTPNGEYRKPYRRGGVVRAAAVGGACRVVVDRADGGHERRRQNSWLWGARRGHGFARHLEGVAGVRVVAPSGRLR